jgi:C-terminal processing protease CtpA/Prc
VLPSFLDFKNSSNNRNNLPDEVNLRFLDSTYKIAYWSIDQFGYLDLSAPVTVVKELNSKETEHLIIDLRNNPGGIIQIAFLANLFLADTTFSFLHRMVATSRWNSVVSVMSLSKWSDYLLLPVQFPIRVLMISPVERLGSFGFQHTDWILNNQWAPGEVYVIINGGTFSAANSLASALQQSGRAKVFGTESGDAAWGDAAGAFKTLHLPNSRMKVLFGLFWMEDTHFDTRQIGRGVIPDYYVPDPSLDDIIQQKDPQMQFVLDYIRDQIEANQTILENQEPVEP